MKFNLVITLILITTFVGVIAACNADPTADADEKPPGWRCGIVNGQMKSWYVTAEGAAGPKTRCPGCNADKCMTKSPNAERGGSGGSNGNGDHPPVPDDCLPGDLANLRYGGDCA